MILLLAVGAAHRVARLLGEQGEPAHARASDPHEQVMNRLLTPVAKFWICKRGAAFAQEAMECLGGNGYVEEGGEGVMARIYREMPLNSIWEGAGNIMALDLLRALRKADAGAALAEAKTAERIDRVAFFIETRCQSDAIRKLQAHDLDGINETILGIQQRKRTGFLSKSKTAKAQVVGILSIEFKKQRTGEIVGVGHGERGNFMGVRGNLKMGLSDDWREFRRFRHSALPCRGNSRSGGLRIRRSP